MIVNCQEQEQYVLGGFEHQYGEEGPLEDKTHLEENRAESWKEGEAKNSDK